jgi:hypothetical protein
MRRLRPWLVVPLTTLCLTTGSPPVSGAPGSVELVRVPDGGIQPDVVTDATGIVHLVYLTGDPAAANVFYARSSDDGRTFSKPVRVNSSDGSAIAAGTIRGAQIAVGRKGRVHVAWNGSDKARPKPPIDPKTGRAGMPMLYARSNLAGSVFEAQRNLMTRTTTLDGGGSIAVDDRAVYVGWHGEAADGGGGEMARRVWIARSEDDGATFAAEAPVSDVRTGVCGCCALRMAVAPGGELHLLYRSATDLKHRDIYALVSRDHGRTFAGGRVHGWDINACPMTSMSVAASRGKVLRAWETDSQVFFAADGAAGQPIAPPGAVDQLASRRKHPRLAIGRDGMILMVWAEGTSWAKGGALGWQVFDAEGRPTSAAGTQPGVPVWSFGTAIARRDGGFTILY